VRRLLPQPAVVVLRPVLHGALLDAAGPDTVSLNSEVCDLCIQDGRPGLTLRGGQRILGDVVIGADGVGSVIRRRLHPDEPPPRRSGLWAVRGVAHGVERDISGLAGAQYFGRGTEGGIARAGPDAVYWYVSVPERQLAGSRDAVTVARRCADQFDQRFRAIVAATEREEMRLDELLDRDPIAAWGRRAVTLLGDAAHPMLPHAGQGAAQALEDAVTIGRVLHRAIDIEAALQQYQETRSKRTEEIVRIARRNARLGSISSPIGQTVRDLAIRALPASVFANAYIEFGTPP
jgi:2-polyprenyl-6-methoxyphenol hydroxylase-like FAD-dependent oxidoreductase